MPISKADRIMMVVDIVARALSAIGTITDRGYDIRQETGDVVTAVGGRRFQVTVSELEGEGET